MKPDLETLKISEKELEVLSGLDIGEIFIGGVLGGVYRSSVLQNPQRLLNLLLTEVIVSALVFIFTIPIALAFFRGAIAQGVSQFSEIVQFLQIPLSITLVVILMWNIYLWFGRKRYQSLMHLLDAIDKYHEILAAIDLLDQLEIASQSQVKLDDRAEVLEALRLTRDNLVAGLMTEKILRENRGLLARRYDLVASIENNVATLKALELNHQADDYGQLLNEAIQISISVRQELQL
jgi:hypothetical protein